MILSLFRLLDGRALTNPGIGLTMGYLVSGAVKD